MRWPDFKFIYIALSVSFSACATSERQLVELGEEFIIFGLYYGECYGNCSELFLLTEENLYTDKVDWAFTWDESGAFIRKDRIFRKKPLRREYFEAAQLLLNKVPAGFAQIESRLFGHPDSYDQGGIYLSMGLGDERKAWLIDPDDSFAEPGFVAEFKHEVFETLNRMNLVTERLESKNK